jgi:hypothetical protein
VLPRVDDREWRVLVRVRRHHQLDHPQNGVALLHGDRRLVQGLLERLQHDVMMQIGLAMAPPNAIGRYL